MKKYRAYQNKVAIVTGGASGIGQALCEELGRYGAEVIVADINREGASHTAGNIEQTGGSAEAVTLDVTIEEDVRRLVEETAASKGRLDYMFNNAGIGISGEVLHMNLSHFQRIVAVNMWGVVYGTLAAYQLMSKQGFGHIVNTSSSAGLVPAPLLTAYGMTKYAVLGLSTGLRIEGAGRGVKVSVVCPGFIDTRIFDTTTYVGSSKDLAWSLLPPWFKAMSSRDCARSILQKVSRNQGIIPVQFPAYLMWWMNRLSPSLFDKLSHSSVERYRKAARTWKS